ncbi:TATA element modulatory factor 1 DNA binding [Trinorchestia longiramus]|nr:TATA element modulatory factor 1 DNA binding [Trinorchestia longiramus]
MTASFTSISESDGGGEVWGMLGGTTSPPRVRQKMGNSASQHYFERGHTRNESTLSETSESSSEHLSSEAEKLGKRVRELTEVLETREQRLLELSQQNVGIQEQNHALQLRVQELEAGGGGGGEGVEEEYTQRLATMEKKFQQALREKEMLSKQLEVLRTETATRLSSSEVQQQLQERDTVILELRTEGEKLSKQQLTYSTTIKKLRAKEKELEAANASHRPNTSYGSNTSNHTLLSSN